jgi:hypothetical protein
VRLSNLAAIPVVIIALITAAALGIMSFAVADQAFGASKDPKNHQLVTLRAMAKQNSLVPAGCQYPGLAKSRFGQKYLTLRKQNIKQFTHQHYVALKARASGKLTKAKKANLRQRADHYGLDRVGRDVVCMGDKPGKPPRHDTVENSTVRFDRWLHPEKYVVHVAPTAPAPAGGVPAGGGSVAGSTLQAIAACESGGNPSTNTGNGFYGKYQFTLGTWASVGGSGNPAQASEAEQDQRAAQLYAQQGSAPWPVCGR